MEPGSELVEREARFRLLNRELEKRTQSLLQHIEDTMQEQDTFADMSSVTFGHRPCRNNSSAPDTPEKTQTPKQESKNTSKQPRKQTPPHSTGTRNAKDSAKETAPCCCLESGASKRDGEWEFLEGFIRVSVQDNLLPKSFLTELASGESVCRFLASKLQLMQEQVDKLQEALDKKAASCETHMAAQAELESDRLRLSRLADTLRTQAERSARRIHTLSRQLEGHKETERRLAECLSEKDKLKAELQRVRSAAAARSAPLEEAVNRLRGQLDAARQADEEFRAGARAAAAAAQAQCVALEQRKRSVQAGVCKLTQLVDNLRRQLTLVQAAQTVRAIERQYAQILQP